MERSTKRGVIGCMEGVVLEEKNAVEWVYRGEGAANVVLGYNGSSPTFVGKVLRIQKTPRRKSQSTAAASVLSTRETILWKDCKEIVSSTSKETVGQLYVLNVMLPLLGSDHVEAGIHVLVSREFLEAVENNILCQRPAWRVDAAKVNILCDSALIISDHSIFSHEGYGAKHFISIIDIASPYHHRKHLHISRNKDQPKCGFLPSSRFINEENAIKKSVSRFRMHQFLKLRQGEIAQVSRYNPLDLFSGSSDRIHKAVKALFTTPQNNFRIFLNGSLIFGGLGGGADSSNSMVGEALEDLLRDVIRAEHGMRLPSFLQLVAETVFRSRVLDQLLEAQKLDSLDIEGAIHAYYNIVSQPCMICKDLNSSELSQRYSSLHSLSLEESLKIVKNYLIAATAKDCSLMISFRPKKSGGSESPYSNIKLDSTGQTFDYKAYFIDLDMKSLKKMVQYYELDQKILSCYAEMDLVECGPSETCQDLFPTAVPDTSCFSKGAVSIELK
ncbi:hypothetical protein IFM89_016574 [Coptis chinensis]|uniref:Inositol-pentakisphosphate 2-kinase n=1 Tax=Coptis chinensis TaxID=261450 RepID=A0A835LV93_9MAGN|nr:hypothetical protein IFM89_016574 [Coptis chinensis]